MFSFLKRRIGAWSAGSTPMPTWERLVGWNYVGVVDELDGSSLFLSRAAPAESVACDLDSKPATALGQIGSYYALARRSSSGNWALLPGGSGWDVPRIDITDRTLTLIRQLPLAVPNLGSATVRGLVWFGDRAVFVSGASGVVPMIEHGDSFREIAGAPPPPSDSRLGSWEAMSATGSMTSPAGTNVLVLNGNGYQELGSGIQLRWHLSADDHRQWGWLPHGTDGFLFLSGRRLYLIDSPDRFPRRIAPGATNIVGMAKGPGDWIVLHLGQNEQDLLGVCFNLATLEYKAVPPDLIGFTAATKHQVRSMSWSEHQGALVFRLHATSVTSIAWESIASSRTISLPCEVDFGTDCIDLLDGERIWAASDSYRDALRRRLTSAIFEDPHQKPHQPPRLPDGGSCEMTIARDGTLVSQAGDPEMVERLGRRRKLPQATWHDGEISFRVVLNRTIAKLWLMKAWS